MCAGVVQLFTLEVNTRAAEVLGEPLGKVERAGAADVITLKIGELALKLRVVFGGGVLILQFKNQRH